MLRYGTYVSTQIIIIIIGVEMMMSSLEYVVWNLAIGLQNYVVV